MNPTQTMGRHDVYTHQMAESNSSPYRNLFLVSLVHFLIMYAVMFTMVDNGSSIYLNLNNVYMTGMMLFPMVLLMPLTMSMMYPNRKLNTWITLSSVIAFGVFFYFMRAQTFIGDKQFIRSMIPHHSGAILMCGKANIQDPEIKNLCGQIMQSQKAEIEQMKQILSRL